MAKTISRRKLIISVLAFSALVSGTACDSEERKKLIEKMLSEELPAPNQELVAVIFGLAISVGALVITRSPSVAMSAGEIGYYFTESIIKIGNLSAVINDLNMQCNTCGKLSQFSDANENKIRVSYNEMASIKCTNPECGQSAHILLTEKEKFDLNSSLKQVYGDKPVCLLTTKKDDDKEETVLVWYTFNAEYISLDGVEVKPKGIKLVNPIKKTSYKLEVIGFNGKDTSELIVKPKIPTYYVARLSNETEQTISYQSSTDEGKSWEERSLLPSYYQILSSEAVDILIRLNGTQYKLLTSTVKGEVPTTRSSNLDEIKKNYIRFSFLGLLRVYSD